LKICQVWQRLLEKILTQRRRGAEAQRENDFKWLLLIISLINLLLFGNPVGVEFE
jgi:hypothetical protein